ncbi:MAG: hypothetical protein KZQ89_04380 [Candidatus Thiodiazotropha sp. (ex Lucinoma kastoroae)]|nr:hypothetical protein [Candidatus Thiodiazotropha sp. (ex Lucinoma kastoroae)]
MHRFSKSIGITVFGVLLASSLYTAPPAAAASAAELRQSVMNLRPFTQLRKAIKYNVMKAGIECIYQVMLPNMAAYAKANPERFNPDYTPYINQCRSSIYNLLISKAFIQIHEGPTRDWFAEKGNTLFTYLALADQACQATILKSDIMKLASYGEELGFLGRSTNKIWGGLTFNKPNSQVSLRSRDVF